MVVAVLIAIGQAFRVNLSLTVRNESNQQNKHTKAICTRRVARNQAVVTFSNPNTPLLLISGQFQQQDTSTTNNSSSNSTVLPVNDRRVSPEGSGRNAWGNRI